MGLWNSAVVALLALCGFPLAAWGGAVLTRPGMALHGVVARHFRLVVVSLVVLNVAGRVADGAAKSKLGIGIEIASTYALATTFMPMLRRLQGQTEEALRPRGAEPRRP